MVRIAPPADDKDLGWLALRLALWPDASEADHLCGMKDAIAQHHHVRLALSPGGDAVGLVEASKRADYVNGTSTSPVAFIEGLYVSPGARRLGVARSLVESVTEWSRSEGCSELASDSLLDNAAAHAVHKALGFEETERVVYFCKSVPVA